MVKVLGVPRVLIHDVTGLLSAAWDLDLKQCRCRVRARRGNAVVTGRQRDLILIHRPLTMHFRVTQGAERDQVPLGIVS